MQNKNQLLQFHNKEFGDIRVLEIDGQPWFVGRDVTAILGYKNHNDAFSKHVDAEDKGVAKCDTLGGAQNLSIINESGLYCLVLSSKQPSAKRFKRWVTSEVLPSIRKHGAYITTEKLEDILRDRHQMDKLANDLKLEQDKTAALEKKSAALESKSAELLEENAALEELAVELAPKALYTDIILQCKNALPVTLIAKDYGLSAQTFNKILYAFGIQYQMRKTWVLYQAYAGKGYTITRTYHTKKKTAVMHTCWTQKGRLFLYDVLKSNGILPLVEIEYTFA